MPSPLSRVVGMVSATFLLSLAAPAQTFTADFSQWTSGPLLKDKIGVYQTPLKTQQTIERSSRFLREAEVQDLRYEIGIGKPGALAYDQVSGTATGLRYNFSSIDGLVRRWKRTGTHPLLAFTYDPLPLQPDSAADAWKDVPDSLPAWSGVNTAYSSHLLRHEHIPGIYYEQWNEPDLPDGNGGKVFFHGDSTSYGQVFRYGQQGVRAGDPDAPVGGPAAAYDLSYLDTIWPQHPDFVSIHAYANYKAQLDNLRGHNGDVVFTPTEPMFLTEYNSYTTFGKDQPVSRHPAAASFFADVNGLLSISDAVKVYWAQWVDDSLGMLTDDLHRKALYNAYRIYQSMMPVDRSPVTPAVADHVGAIASADPHNAGMVLYNTGTTDATVTVQLNHLPFRNGVAELYLIDASHASYLDGAPEDLAVSRRWRVAGNSTAQQITVKAESVAFVKLSDGSRRSLLQEDRLGTRVGTKYDFFNRIFTFEDDSFADLDPRTSIARLGMATTTSTSDFGVVATGAVYDNPVHRFTVDVTKQGPFSKNDSNSIFGLRLDFQSTNGTYTRSVLFHNGLYDPTRTSSFPWGEATAVPDQAIFEPGMNTGQPFTVDLARIAPPDWNRKRVIVSPVMQNAGYGSYARMVLRPVALRRFGFAHGSLVEIAASGEAKTTEAAVDATRTGGPIVESLSASDHQGELDQRITGLDPNRTYNLRLRFAESPSVQPGQRRFNVLLNGSVALEDFDIAAEAGEADGALVEQVTATADPSGAIRVQLQTGAAGTPQISGIEVY